MRALAMALVLSAVLVSASSSGASRNMTINGMVRPATFGNGDGSVITGGPDGTGQYSNFGHIRWTAWTRSGAVGWGVSWTWAACSNTDFDPRCSPYYRLYVREGGRVSTRASRSVNGRFTRVENAGGCWRLLGVGDYWPVNCRTWYVSVPAGLFAP